MGKVAVIFSLAKFFTILFKQFLQAITLTCIRLFLKGVLQHRCRLEDDRDISRINLILNLHKIQEVL